MDNSYNTNGGNEGFQLEPLEKKKSKVWIFVSIFLILLVIVVTVFLIKYFSNEDNPENNGSQTTDTPSGSDVNGISSGRGSEEKPPMPPS